MSSTAGPRPDGGVDIVVDPDGTLHVPAAELARHGFPPGSHLRLVAEAPPTPPRRSAREALAGRALHRDDIHTSTRGGVG